MATLAELPKKYPQLFKNDYFYFECGDGWYTLLNCLLNQIHWKLKRYSEVVEIQQKVLSKGEEPLPWISEYFEKNPVDPLEAFSIHQIKEKFGGLRFYWGCDVDSDETRELRGATDLAESLSYTICEECGAPASGTKTAKGSGWIRSLCETHHQERQSQLDARGAALIPQNKAE